MTRRTFLAMAAADHLAAAAAVSSIKAIAFDGLAVFDPRPVSTLAQTLFPGKGADLINLWRTRQFEYSWLRTLTGAYTDFWRLTEDALVFSAKLLNLDLALHDQQQLMEAFLHLRAWPDVPPVLQRLKASGLRLVLLSNFTETMLNAAVENSGLQGIFGPHLSTDKVRAYKPHPRAYHMAVDALKLNRRQIAFAAFGGWDAAGAKSFGFPTFWVNRMNLPVEELGPVPDATGPDFQHLLHFVTSRTYLSPAPAISPPPKSARHDL